MNTTRISNRAKAMPIFTNCGVSVESRSRINAWEEWAGPEEPRAMEISLRMQYLHDSLISDDEEVAWMQALESVVEHARYLVPYKDDEDAYYAPNIAVWELAWVLALEEVHISKAIPIPNFLKAQIHWYERGHWPCELISLESDECPEDYVVY